MRLSLSLVLTLALSAAVRVDEGRIADRMQEMIARNEVPGAVTLVVTRDGVKHAKAIGKSGPSSQNALKVDSIFWIASMTKPITGVAIMMLQDEGKLSVDDPVSKYIPAFADLKAPSGEPAKLTLKHLMTHTSGLAEATPDEARASRTLADLIPNYLTKPMQFQPGSQWKYCQSGINTLGRIIEVVSQEPLESFLSKRLFGPLGMTDTTFYLRPEQLPRLVTPAKRSEQGVLEATPVAFLQGKEPTATDRFPAANGGLFSTGPDYARFVQMLLNGGTLKGKRYLKPESLRQMTTIQTGNLQTGFTPGNGWGLTVCVVREPQGITAMLSPGTYGHGGAYGTQAWIDPVKGVATVLMVQRSNFQNSDNSPVRLAFQEAVAAQ